MFSYRAVPRSGVRYSLILEWFLAARWANINWFDDFNEMDSDDMAFVVAAYRTHMQIESVTAYYASKRRK